MVFVKVIRSGLGKMAVKCVQDILRMINKWENGLLMTKRGKSIK
jgi:hypothetical protein